MYRAEVVFLLLSTTCWAAPSSAVAASARRVEQLAAKEAVQSRVDTRLRAAQLLAATAPDTSKRFLDAALAELGQVTVSRGMVMSLMAVDPERGPALLLASRDKTTACNLLINYWATRAQPGKALSLLRQLAGERVTGLVFNIALVRGLAASDPLEAVGLLELMIANARLFAPPTSVSQAAGIVSMTLTSTARERPDHTRLALRRMWSLIQSPEFQKLPGRMGPYSVSVNGASAQVASSHEVVKIRLAALAKVIDAQTYARHAPELEKWSQPLSTVNTLDHVTVGVPPPPPALPAPFDYDKAVASLKQVPLLKDRIVAAQNVMNRPDVSLDQKRAVALYILPLVEAVTDASERSNVGSLLLDDYAIYLLGKPILERAVRIHLDGTSRSDQHPESYGVMAQVIDAFDLNVGKHSPPIAARLELYRLGRLLSDTYDFNLPSLSSGNVSLRSLRGKAVLLNFWATWCGPCRTEMPILEKLHREFGPTGFTVVAVSDEDRATVQKYIQSSGYSFPVLLDPDRRVFDHFRVMAIPATKVFDRNGLLMAEVENTTEAELRQLIENAAKKRGAADVN